MPTIFIQGRFRYYFFSREEERRHVHVSSSNGEVKIWLEPEISVAKVINLSKSEVNEIVEVVQSRKEEIYEFWDRHFGKN